MEKYWYPVDFSGFKIKEINLFGNEILVLNNEKYFAFQNRCPHRNAKLSLGKIVSDRIKCSYHGWEFDMNGKCIYVPSSDSEGHVNLKKYNIKEKNGIVWISLDIPDHDVPEFPEFNDITFRKIKCGPYIFNSNPFRVMENILDVSHFAFVHEGYLGDSKYPQIPKYEVEVNNNEIIAKDIKVWQPNPDGTGETKLVSYTYKVLDPLILYFRKNSDEKIFSMYFAIFPESKQKSIVYAWIAMNYAFDYSEEKIRSFEDEVMSQDKMVVESQPYEYYLDVSKEYHVEADKATILYRYWINKKIGKRPDIGLI